MATEEEKNKPQEEETRRQETTPAPKNDNQGAENNGPDRNPVELSKKRQRKELRKDTGGNSEGAGVKPGFGEMIREDIRNDIDNAKKEIAEAKEAFTPARKREQQQPQQPQAQGNGGALPVTGIQGGGYSTPDDAPAEGEGGIQQDQFADPAEGAQPADAATETGTEPAPTDAPAPDAPQTGQDPTLTQRVNEGYRDVAAGVAPTDSAKVEGSEESSNKTYNKNEQETKTLTAPAQELYNRNNADIEAARLASAAAQEKYGVQNTQDLIDGRIKEAEEKAKAEGKTLSAKERRKIKRDTEREQEARLDKLYRELDPNYRSSKEFKREQNIKTIIGAIGKLGTLAGKTVTAANSGILLPTRDFSDGILEDVRISKKEREQLLHAYDEIRKSKINEPLARLQEAEKNQLDLVKSGAAYQTVKNTSGSEDENKSGAKVTKKKEPIDYKDWIEAQGGAKNMFGKLQNGEYIIPDIYKNGMPSGAHKVTVDVFNNATGNLFDVFKTLPGVKTDTNGNIEDENGNIWVDLHQLQEDIAGATEAGTREKLQQRYIEYLDKMLKAMEKSDAEVAQKALNDYSRLIRGASLAYKSYNGDDTTEQQGDLDDTI